MARTTFDDTYRGGRVEPEADKPKPRLRYPCFANGCPMPGTIWPGAGVGGTGDAPGTCGWHYGVNANDIPKVTQVLNDWRCIAYEVNAARHAHSFSDAVSSPKDLQTLFDAAVGRLMPQVQGSGWNDDLQPRRGEDYRSWGQRMESFLAARVSQVLDARRSA